MYYFNKIIKVLITLQIIIISTFNPLLLPMPDTNQLIQTFEIPISWQIPSIIVLTFIFKGEVVLTAFSLYLLIGLFFLPVFHDGGSLGYLLTPNFGYLLGIFPLVINIDKINKLNRKIYYPDLLKYEISGICSMHIIGILYSFIQSIYIRQPENVLYNISKYSLGKFAFHLLMLIPITLIIKLIYIKSNYKK